MTEIPKNGWLGVNEEDELQAEKRNESEQMSLKSVMVFLVDKETLRREPIGIITEQRKSERDGNNAIGMLRLARKEFATSEEMAKRIVIGDYL